MQHIVFIESRLTPPYTEEMEICIWLYLDVNERSVILHIHKRIASRHKNDLFNKSFICTQVVHSKIEIRLDRDGSRVFQESFQGFPSKRLLKKPRKPREHGNQIPSRKVTFMEMQQAC